jgi:hypothetical protein
MSLVEQAPVLHLVTAVARIAIQQLLPSELKGSVGHGHTRNVLLMPHPRLLHLHVHPVLHLARCLLYK